MEAVHTTKGNLPNLTHPCSAHVNSTPYVLRSTYESTSKPSRFLKHVLSLCVTARRQEAAARAHLRRKANQERKRRIEVRRLAEAEAVRVKHEGPSLAEVVSDTREWLIRMQRMAQLQVCCSQIHECMRDW